MTPQRDTFPINVVICTQGRCSLMQRTLDSLAAVERPTGFEKVWVVENGSDCGTRLTCEQAKTRLPLQYIHLDQPGKSRAIQHALDQITRGLVVFTDDDVRVNPTFLTAYAHAAATHGPDAFYGGPLCIDYEKSPAPWLLSHLPPSVTGWQMDDPNAAITKAAFLGANYGAFIERINSVGGFMAHLGIGSQGNPVGEEFEIQDRLLADGAKGVYIPDAKVWHYVPRERSTPKWTLRRHERIWFTSALTDTSHNEKPWLWNAPRWMWRRLLALWVKATAAQLIPNPQKRFQNQMLYYQWRGTLRGVQLRHKRQATQSPQNHG